MIKNIPILAITGLIIAMLSGCSKQPNLQESVNAHCIKDGIPAPKWICTPQSYDAESILGLGKASMSEAGESFTINNAIAEAHNNLAFSIQTHVKAKIEHFVNETGMLNQKATESIQTQVLKQLANATLNDSKQLELWQTPKTTYILVGISNNAINTKIKKEFLRNSHNNQDPILQQFQSTEALDSLNKEFPTK